MCALQGFKVDVHHRTERIRAVAFPRDGPCPASAAGAFGGEAFRSKGSMEFAEEGAQNGNALYKDGTSDLGRVPNVGDAEAL